MAELNQYAISKVLGSKMKHLQERPRFGNIGLLSTTSDILRTRGRSEGTSIETQPFSYSEDAKVVRAFEDVRKGAATDALLWDKKLFQAFVRRCAELGLKAPAAYLARRLLGVRKNSPRYAQHGITISPTTKKVPHESIVPQYAHVIEFALVRLRFRYGASIDDILMDPDLGDQFEELASRLAPGVSSVVGHSISEKRDSFRKASWRRYRRWMSNKLRESSRDRSLSQICNPLWCLLRLVSSK